MTENKPGLLKVFTHRDYMGKSALDLMVEEKLYKVMQVELVDRVVREVYSSKYDQSGDFFALSMPYRILFDYNLRFKED